MNMRTVLLSSLLFTAGSMQCEEFSILSSTKEDEIVEIVSSEQQVEAVVPAVWYKKRSTQIVAAAVACAVGAYAIAVYMDKFALWKKLDELAEQKRIRDLKFAEIDRNYKLENDAQNQELMKNAILLDDLAAALKCARIMQDKYFRHCLLAREFLWGHDERRKQAEEEFSLLNDLYTEKSKERSTLLDLYHELRKKNHELFVEYMENREQPSAPDVVLIEPVQPIIPKSGILKTLGII